MKKTQSWIWVEDSNIRKAVITDLHITIYDENDNIIIRIKNPSKSFKKRMIKEISKHKNVSNSGGSTYGVPKESA